MKPASLHKHSVPDPAYMMPWFGTLAVFAIYVLVNLWLYERVIELIAHVANPFFVILLVAVTVIGQLLTIWQTKRLLDEGKHLNFLSRRFKSHENEDRATQLAALDETLLSGGKGLQVTQLFSHLQKKDGQAAQHDAVRLEHQLEGFVGDILRRTTLPQYIANTLIGLGLFGTFLGLIVTLKEVAGLIGMFGVVGSDGSSDMMAEFFKKMSGPLAGMGDAFVASLLGLGGSIVNNLQLLATKKLQRVICQRGEDTYLAAAEAVCTQHDEAEQAVREKAAAVDGQISEIRAIRGEMHQQTDAILLASSRMRQVSEPLAKWLESLEKRMGQQAQDRPQLEQIAGAMEQRLGMLVHKFEESQLAHQGMLNAVRAMESHLGDLAASSAISAEEQKSAARKLGELHLSATQDGELARQALREQIEALRTTLHEDLRQVGATLEETTRQQREHGQSLGAIQLSSNGAMVAVETLGAQLLQQGQQLRPQLTDLIARVDKLDLTLGAAQGGARQTAERDPHASSSA